MTVTANPKIVEELMRILRKEVARRRGDIAATFHRPAQTVFASSSALENLQLETIHLPRFGDTAPSLPTRQSYILPDLLNFHDEAFIRNAYWGILHREPDSNGFMHYLAALRSGRYTKAEILGRLRYSSEGRTHAVQIRGLFVPFVLQSAYHIPVLGYMLAWVNFILRLPSIVRNWNRFEAYTAFQHHEQTQQVNQLAEQAERSLRAVDAVTENKADRDEFAKLRIALDEKATLSALQQALAEFGAKVKQFANIEANLFVLGETTEDLLRKIQTKFDIKEFDNLWQALEARAGRAELEEVRRQLDAKADRRENDALRQALEARAGRAELEEVRRQLDAKTDTRADAKQLVDLTNYVHTTDKQMHATLADIQRQVLDHKRNIVDQQRRLTLLLEEARKRLPESMAQEQIERMVAEEDHLLDAFYVSFEDCFRGTREDIKQRMEIYLPIVREAKAGDEDAPILDIGCGRGEWLELLKEAGLTARGVDLNRIMVGQCRELCLEVMEADAIDYLRKLNANSLGAVTGMHIIEHIPFKKLIVLFEETLRTLKSGGVAIFETPNPENLITGACNFYYDPTHLNPLPPEPMRFVMEIRGFHRIEILRLHPFPEKAKLQDGPAQMLQVINDRLFGAQDYALVAYKI